MTRSDAGDEPDRPSAVELPLVAIIDDDASVRTSCRRLIRSLGYRAEAFASGQQFLTSPLAERAGCVLLDVRMPEMNGLEVQRRILTRNPHLPVVFISGRASDDEESRARSAGAIDFLRKPISKATLLEVLRKALLQEGDLDEHTD